jgi:hypothetical protein
VLVKLPHTNPDDFIGNNVGENEVVNPLVMSSESKGCAVNIPFRKTMTLKAKKIHGHELGFTIIFHKIQGQTCDKLIVDLNKRPSQPQVTFATFYVAISRVRRSSVLRLLPLHHREKNLSHLLTLKAPKELNTWLAAYNPRNGMWHPKRIKEDNDQNSEEKSILKSTKKNYKKNLFLNPEMVNTVNPMQQFLPIPQKTVKTMSTKNGKDVNHEYLTKHPKGKNPSKYLILQENTIRTASSSL